jgi:hypothetical protein
MKNYDKTEQVRLFLTQQHFFLQIRNEHKVFL